VDGNIDTTTRNFHVRLLHVRRPIDIHAFETRVDSAIAVVASSDRELLQILILGDFSYAVGRGIVLRENDNAIQIPNISRLKSTNSY
jgi:hypothetical protein